MLDVGCNASQGYHVSYHGSACDAGLAFILSNELIESLDLGEDMNERSSADFIEAVRAFLN